MTKISVATDSLTFEVGADLASLAITAADGPCMALAADRLRLSCRCAHCIRARLDDRFPESFPGIAIVEIADLGYGLNISFSDGHNRGIYPRSYLLSLTDN